MALLQSENAVKIVAIVAVVIVAVIAMQALQEKPGSLASGDNRTVDSGALSKKAVKSLMMECKSLNEESGMALEVSCFSIVNTNWNLVKEAAAELDYVEVEEGAEGGVAVISYMPDGSVRVK